MRPPTEAEPPHREGATWGIRPSFHPDNRAETENREVKCRPERLRNRAQDQQRDRGAARESVHQADGKRA